MSYRVDIPTLSANEVYTLTFEYEGTETIQLIVGDLTLETTDRRVVFTTTSPVNYIESNVNLTNLNMYEGYYESDDFGGEYTQESYIEGMSLVNLKNKNSCFLTDNWYQKVEILEDGYRRISHVTNDKDISCFYLLTDNNNFAKELKGEKYTIILDIRKNTFPSDVAINFGLSYNTSDSYEKIDDDIFNAGDRMCKQILGGQTGRAEIVIRNTTVQTTQIPSRYWGTISGVSSTTDGTNLSSTLNGRTDFDGCILEYMITVIEGDYYGQGIKPFSGIAYVKSPRVISREQPLNMFYCTDWTSTLNNGTVTCQDGKFYFDGSFSGYTWFDIINGGEVKNNIYLEPGSYHAKMKAHSKEPCMANGICVSIEATMENGNTIDLCSVYTSKDKIYNGVTETNKEFTSPIVKLTLKIWYGGNGNNNIVIDGIYLSKTNTTNDLAFKENHAVVTPNNLELYSGYDSNGNWYGDKLDLTTGTFYQYYDMWDLATLLSQNGPLTGFGYNSDTNTVYVQYSIGSTHPSGTVWGGQGGYSALIGNYFEYGHGNAAYEKKTSPYIAFFNKYLYISGMSYDEIFNGVTIINNGSALNWNEAVSALIQFATDNNLKIGLPLNTPTTEQLSLNPLKSYRNGSIQTSSQQLAPTLKTTLPISNKFTTTNLTSGSTYNVYFDGTATKLDAGGTIITNPVSPCEVECGGTTLTIEGTDIQNVRVLETTVKNEVGSVCGTTDVELSRVKCVRGIPNLLSTLSTDWENGTDYGGCIRYKYGIDVQPNEKYVFTVSNIGGLYYKEIAIWNTDTWVSNAESIITTQKLTPNTPYIFTVPSGVTKVYIYFPYDNTGNLNQAHEYELRMQEGTVDLGYGGQKEATIPLVCNLEQPIKLRSLGATYDSYNPVTGELTKRIGVSETDGSYSVLSSPIVDKFEKSYSFMSNLATSDQLLVYNGATKNGDVITLNKANRWSLVQLAGSCTRMEKGKQYMCILHDIVGDMTDVCFVRQLDTTSEILPMENNRVIFTAMSNASNRWCFIQQNEGMAGGGTVSFKVSIVEYFEGAERLDIPYFNTYEQRDLILQLLYPTIPQLYTNGQVKVYSDSDVYPTTILNGQSTNNYEINELNTSNNYTIRYDGECESINLANKSNTQGNNVLVKAGAASGNLTFVNDNGYINNVLLVQNDVREQEINYFNGLETVEVSGMLIENQRNMWTNNPNNYVVSGWQATSTHYIPVKPGEVIYGTWQWNNYAGMTQYDENFNQLMGVNFFGPDSYGTGMSAPQQIDGYYRNQCTILENARYVRFTIPTSASSTIMFYRGGYQTELVTPTDKIYQGTFVDLPQPVQLNSLLDGTHDTYNPITGEYVQNVGYLKASDATIEYRSNTTTHIFAIKNSTITNPPILASGWATYLESSVLPRVYNETTFGITQNNLYWYLGMCIPKTMYPIKEDALQWILNNVIILYKVATPITTQLTPINIPTFEGGMLQLITTDGKVFPMIEYSMPTNNRYDTSSWETGVVYTQRNMTEAYFNESTTPMTPTETMTLTTDHISSGSIILNDNGNGLIVLKGNYTGRDIPYFTGMRSVEAIEVETTPSPDQPLFGKGGRK